jgi:hypothetical protein
VTTRELRAIEGYEPRVSNPYHSQLAALIVHSARFCVGIMSGARHRVATEKLAAFISDVPSREHQRRGALFFNGPVRRLKTTDRNNPAMPIRVISEGTGRPWPSMKVRSITKKPLNTTNTPPDITGRRLSTMRLVTMKQQAITLIWHTDTIC